MATKITYLLGAGASCDTMPLASALGERLEKASKQIREDIEKKHGSPDSNYPEEDKPWTKGNQIKKLLENFEWLAECAKSMPL